MTDIFSGAPAPAPAGVEPQAPAPSALDTMLDSIKNETGQRKYASVEAALEALKHSQEYIPTLKTQLTEKEQRLAELEEQAARAKKLEDLVASLTAPPSTPTGEGNPPQASGLNEQAVVELVRQTLGQSEQQKIAQANEASVRTALVEKYGDKAAEVVSAKAAQLGMSPADIKGLSQRSPALVLEIFGTQAKPTPTTTTSSINVPPINDKQPEIKRPDKSVLVGATSKEVTAHFKDIKAAVYAKHGITQ